MSNTLSAKCCAQHFADVAGLYGLDTREINQAVKNNPEKFPDGYLIELDANEKGELIKIFDRLKKLKHSSATVKGFTEKGLYMLATILKSPKAVETTLAIIDTFTKVREVSRTIKAIPNTPENTSKHQELMQKTGELISDLVIPDELDTSETEASIEVNFALVKFKYAVKKKGKGQ